MDPLPYQRSPDNPSLLARITGVARRPRYTFSAVVARPRWAGLLATLTVASFATAAALLSTEVGRQALVDQWERTALAFGRPVDAAAYAEMQDLSRYAVPYAASTAVARGPFAALALAALLYGVFTARGARASFRQVLAVVVHASVILTLRDVIAAPISYVRESIASPVTLVTFLGTLDEASPFARFFALIDLFVVWWMVVLGIGLAVLYRMERGKLIMALLGAYVGVAVVLAGSMALLRGNS